MNVLCLLLACGAPQGLPIGEGDRVVHVLGSPFTRSYYESPLEVLLVRRGAVYRRVDLGRTTEELLRDLDRRVLVHEPTLVVLQTGNEELRSQYRRPAFDYSAWPRVLESLVARLREQKVRVVLCSPVPGGGRETQEGLKSWVDAAREVAGRHGAFFVDLFTEALDWPMIGPGGYHYDPQGHERSWGLLARQLGFEPLSWSPAPELKEELARGHRLTASCDSIRAYRLPEWVALPDFERQREGALRGALDDLARHDARVRGMVPQDPATVPVYVSGQEGYHSYRIPSAIVTPKGAVLAFAEGRKNSRSDSGDIDLVLRRSADGGATWSAMEVVWDDGPNTCGNPCPVIDRSTGTIWLLLTHNLGADTEKQIVERTAKGTRTVWVSKSDDDGVTWAKPVEITKAVKDAEWTWYATGPGVGIQTRKGRLVVPCDSKNTGGARGYSFVIVSDDQGLTWRRGGAVGDLWNECQVAELSDGRLMLNMRNHDRTKKERGVALSADGGETWTAAAPDPALVEPVCQASLLRIDPARLAFSNPASLSARERLTIRLSLDDGKTWPVARELHPGPAAYSCLVALPGGRVGCLYEAGEKNAYERIVFSRFTRDWLDRK